MTQGDLARSRPRSAQNRGVVPTSPATWLTASRKGDVRTCSQPACRRHWRWSAERRWQCGPLAGISHQPLPRPREGGRTSYCMERACAIPLRI